MGLGLATLVAPPYHEAIHVDNVRNVHVAGLLLEAGKLETKARALLVFGDYNNKGGYDT